MSVLLFRRGTGEGFSVISPPEPAARARIQEVADAASALANVEAIPFSRPRATRGAIG